MATEVAETADKKRAPFAKELKLFPTGKGAFLPLLEWRYFKCNYHTRFQN